VLVGYLIGFRFTEGVISAIGAVLVVGLFGYVLGWIFTYMALVVPGAEAAQTAGFVIVFPLVFASSIFVPIETMPSWLQGFAANSPVSLAADATRALSIGGAVARPLLLTVLWAAVILAIAIPASVRRYRRMT
jgi:ABC-type multidrug transport system permease subunit